MSSAPSSRIVSLKYEDDDREDQSSFRAREILVGAVGVLILEVGRLSQQRRGRRFVEWRHTGVIDARQ